MVGVVMSLFYVHIYRGAPLALRDTVFNNSSAAPRWSNPESWRASIDKSSTSLSSEAWSARQAVENTQRHPPPHRTSVPPGATE